MSQLLHDELVALPAMMLATCVPCPKRSLVVLAEGSKFALYTMRFAFEPGIPRSGVEFTPLSITATPTPVPSYPIPRATLALTVEFITLSFAVVEAICSLRSTEMYLTFVLRLASFAAAVGDIAAKPLPLIRPKAFPGVAPTDLA